MSAPRKNATRRKAALEVDRLKQRLMLTEHHASMLETFARAAAVRADAAYTALKQIADGVPDGQAVAAAALEAYRGISSKSAPGAKP